MESCKPTEKILSVNPELFSHLPVAFALMEVTREKGEITKVSYAYVNEHFCALSLRGEEEFLGKDIAEVHNQKAKEAWLEYIATIEKSKEAIKGCCFYAPLGGKVNYIIAPTHKPDYFAVMYINVDVKEEEFQRLQPEKLINEASLDLAHKIYESALDQGSLVSLLKTIAQRIQAQRVYFVILGKEKAIVSQYKKDESLPDPISPTSGVIAPLLPPAEKVDTPLLLTEAKANEGDALSQAFLSMGVKTHLAFPFLIQGRLTAYLCADNFPLENIENAKKILQNSCYFMSFKWSNDQLMKELRTQARKDQLTGLLNRYGFEEAAKDYFATHCSETCVFALIDIDDFKLINDSYGHRAGDLALQSLSQEIRSYFGEEAIVGRFGGDEISLLLPKQSLEEAEKKFSEFASSKHGFLSDGHNVDISISVGFTEYPAQAKDFNALLLCADKACYAAKLFGKGQSLSYQKSYDDLDKTILGFNFHSIADNLPVPFFLFGDKGGIYYANSPCLKLFGYETLLDLISKSRRGVYSLFEVNDALKDFLGSKEKKQTTISLNLNSGKKVSLLVSAKSNLPSSVHYGVLLEK